MLSYWKDHSIPGDEVNANRKAAEGWQQVDHAVRGAAGCRRNRSKLNGCGYSFPARVSGGYSRLSSKLVVTDADRSDGRDIGKSPLRAVCLEARQSVQHGDDLAGYLLHRRILVMELVLEVMIGHVR